MAKDDKLEEEAKLFLYFVYKIKNLPVEQCENIFESDGIQYIKIKKRIKYCINVSIAVPRTYIRRD
ncbi:hypothetical protein HERIO_1547 [Hepatospora eriocheir]|uniref:Uncharacterized protein n=1 Tax=Hepatospora eriocheir TaxID=1081669 RepID=A0A1X0Q9T3_9MICR|nr:hypothetical protein HERIO_1547 [Hepatospora eriocheir]